MPKLTERQFYCVKCRTKRTLSANDICVKIYKNSRMYDGMVPTLRSLCPECDTNLTKFVKHDLVDYYMDKYGDC